MYNVEEFRWIQVASMYLNDAAAHWFQSVEHKLRYASWRDFALLLMDRFNSAYGGVPRCPNIAGPKP
jgi:hypothetical protein